LVVDDEPDIRELVREILEAEGLTVVEAPNGRAALKLLHEQRPNIVLLDVMMPDLDGWRTLERIRDISDLPVLMLTARALDWERARGLRAGADDYMVKPFSAIELAARVAALLRRVPVTHERPLDYVDDVLRIEFARREVTVAGGPVALTPLEFRMLRAFVDHPDEVLPRERLLELVWGSKTAVFPDQVKLYVGYLRRKLESRLGQGCAPIETIRGFGYRYSTSGRAAETS
jgi:DNA-binding response OmpR family regulator